MPLVSHLFTVDGSEPLRAIRFEGAEGISELYQFEVILASEDGAIDFATQVGKTALLSIGGQDTEAMRQVHGIVARFEQLDIPSGATKKMGAIYRATLVPRPYLLQHRRTSRIFQELSAPEVVKKVLEGAGLAADTDFRLSVQGTYAKREYCVQYRESDWDFVCRLLEEEGIFFFFEHSEDKHVLVIADASAIHEPIEEGTLVYRPAQGAMGSVASGTSFVTRFAWIEEVRPGTVVLRDFNFKKPALDLTTNKQQATVDQALEIYDYPGEYDLKADGDQLSKVRLQALQVTRKTGDGDSVCNRLFPGAKFTLDEHPREGFNREYLIVRVEHRGMEPAEGMTEGDSLYANHFEVIASDVPFRPARVTPRPAIRGVQTAIVVGPAGEEIHVDEHGRVKVQFHWDRLGKKDDKSSCWIRVSQLWAGEGFGAMFIPRIGHEVVVSFEEGDPDRPLVVGRVYHGTNVPPYPLPANKTRSTIKSKSSPKDEGFNEIRFEDKKGSEEVWFHAQKDHNGVVENDETWAVKHDQSLTVTNDRTKKIDHDQKETVGNDETIEVKHDRIETIGNDETVTVKHDRKTTIENDHTSTVKGLETLTVEKAQDATYNDTVTTKIAKDHKVTIGGEELVNIAKAVTHTYDDAFDLKIAKDRGEKVEGGATLDVTKDQKITVGGAHKQAITGNSEITVDGKQKLVVQQEIAIECGQAKITLKADGTITIEGVQLQIKGQASVKIQGAQVEVKGDGTAKLETGGKMDLKATMLDMSGSAMVKVGGGLVGLG
jgi:type VI secretion system secreted protein VgrG